MGQWRESQEFQFSDEHGYQWYLHRETATVQMQMQQWVIGMMDKFTYDSMSTHFITSSLLLLISKAEDSIWNRHPKWRVGVESSSKGDANHFLRLYKSYSKMLFLKGRVEEKEGGRKREGERGRGRGIGKGEEKREGGRERRREREGTGAWISALEHSSPC